MAEQQILFSWTPFGGSEFDFVDPYDNGDFDAGNLDYAIPQATTAGDGEYQNDSHVSVRMATMVGTIVGPDLSTVQTYLNTLLGVHPKGGAGQLRQRIVDPIGGVVSDLYHICRVSDVQPGKQDGFNRRDWKITYRSVNPYWLSTAFPSTTLVSTTLTDSGSGASHSATWTPGGPLTVLPIFTVVVATPGTVTITPSAVFGLDSAALISFNADTADTWTVNCETGVLYRAGLAGVNLNDHVIAGGLNVEVLPTAVTMTVAVSAGAAISSASVACHQRFGTI